MILRYSHLKRMNKQSIGAALVLYNQSVSWSRKWGAASRYLFFSFSSFTAPQPLKVIKKFLFRFSSFEDMTWKHLQGPAAIFRLYLAKAALMEFTLWRASRFQIISIISLPLSSCPARRRSWRRFAWTVASTPRWGRRTTSTASRGPTFLELLSAL